MKLTRHIMTVDEIKARVAEIEAMRDDDAEAHVKEDGLYQDVLSAIARGECADPAGCAAAALETVAICFARWCD